MPLGSSTRMGRAVRTARSRSWSALRCMISGGGRAETSPLCLVAYLLRALVYRVTSVARRGRGRAVRPDCQSSIRSLELSVKTYKLNDRTQARTTHNVADSTDLAHETQATNLAHTPATTGCARRWVPLTGLETAPTRIYGYMTLTRHPLITNARTYLPEVRWMICDSHGASRHTRSPRMRRASWMSLGMMVTRLAWMAHRLVSSKRPTR